MCCWRNVSGFLSSPGKSGGLQTVDEANITASSKLKALTALRTGTVGGITVTHPVLLKSQKQTSHHSCLLLAALRKNTKLTVEVYLYRRWRGWGYSCVAVFVVVVSRGAQSSRCHVTKIICGIHCVVDLKM